MWWIFVNIWANKTQSIAYFQLLILFKSWNWFICSLFFMNLTLWLHLIGLCCFCCPIKIRNLFAAFSLQNVSFPTPEKYFGQDFGAIPIFDIVNILKMEEKKLFKLKSRVDLLFVVVNDELKIDFLQTWRMKNLKLVIRLA